MVPQECALGFLLIFICVEAMLFYFESKWSVLHRWRRRRGHRIKRSADEDADDPSDFHSAIMTYIVKELTRYCTVKNNLPDFKVQTKLRAEQMIMMNVL